MIKELEPGGQFPDLQLPNAAGRPRQLSELAGEDPVVLQFFRGWWCPKETQFFRRLLDLQADAEVGYARFVSVSVDPPDVLAAFRAGLDARWTFLSDERGRYLDPLGLREGTDTVHDPHLPTCCARRHRRHLNGAFIALRPRRSRQPARSARSGRPSPRSGVSAEPADRPARISRRRDHSSRRPGCAG